MQGNDSLRGDLQLPEHSTSGVQSRKRFKFNVESTRNRSLLDEELHSTADFDISPNSDTSSNSSNRCRYCLSPAVKNYSQCQCTSHLCRACLRNELKLTEGRNSGVMECTVCKAPYSVQLSVDSSNVSVTQWLSECMSIAIGRNEDTSASERRKVVYLLVFEVIWVVLSAFIVASALWKDSADFRAPIRGVNTGSAAGQSLAGYSQFLIAGISAMDWCVAVNLSVLFTVFRALQFQSGAVSTVVHLWRVVYIWNKCPTLRTVRSIWLLFASASLAWNSLGMCFLSIRQCQGHWWLVLNKLKTRAMTLRIGNIQSPFSLFTPNGNRHRQQAQFQELPAIVESV